MYDELKLCSQLGILKRPDYAWLWGVVVPYGLVLLPLDSQLHVIHTIGRFTKYFHPKT